MTIRLLTCLALTSCLALAQTAVAAAPGQTGGSETVGPTATGRIASPTYTKMLRTQFKYDLPAATNLGTGTVPITPMFINMNCTNSAGCGLDADINIGWGPLGGAGSLNLCVQVDTATPLCRFNRVDGGYYTSAVIDVFTPVTFGTHAVKVTGRVVGGATGWIRAQSVARYTLYAR